MSKIRIILILIGGGHSCRDGLLPSHSAAICLKRLSSISMRVDQTVNNEFTDTIH